MQLSRNAAFQECSIPGMRRSRNAAFLAEALRLGMQRSRKADLRSRNAAFQKCSVLRKRIRVLEGRFRVLECSVPGMQRSRKADPRSRRQIFVF